MSTDNKAEIIADTKKLVSYIWDEDNDFNQDLYQIFRQQAQLVIYKDGQAVAFKHAGTYYYNSYYSAPPSVLQGRSRPLHPSLVKEFNAFLSTYETYLTAQAKIEAYLTRLFFYCKKRNINYYWPYSLPSTFNQYIPLVATVNFPAYEEWFEQEQDSFAYFQKLILKKQLLKG